nr:putative minor structural protein [Bat sapovirus]
MGSWATGAMMAAGAASDMVTGLGNLVLNAINMSNQNAIQRKQLALSSRALDLQERQLEFNAKLANPVERYSMALSAGFDPISARQVAGSSEWRTVGATALPSISSHTLQAMQRTSAGMALAKANQIFVGGLPTSGGIARPVPYNQLPGNNRPNLAAKWNESHA